MSSASSGMEGEPHQEFRFEDLMQDSEKMQFVRRTRGFIIAVPKGDAYGDLIPCKLETSHFINELRRVGMPVKVLENVCQPCDKYTSSGKKYCGDIAYSHLFKSEAVWKKIAASPSSLGVLISHLNCYCESLMEDGEAWAFVMEEDVYPHENSLFFFSELMAMMAGAKFNKKTDVQLIHLIHDRENHKNTKLLVSSDPIIASEHVHLLRAPKNESGRHLMVGQGARAYLISPNLMRIFTDHGYKWNTWIDLEVNRSYVFNMS